MGNYKKYAERHLRTCELLLENGVWNISAQNGVSYIEKILKKPAQNKFG